MHLGNYLVATRPRKLEENVNVSENVGSESTMNKFIRITVSEIASY